ncbi:putative Late embryogenesis abundant protein [Helianthus annuus]|nr:putative Late embryogenesis abundant protein [Helianthus annuus]
MPPTPQQPHLNGAYYGPSIPPKTKSSNRPSRRRGGGGSCNPLTCCFSCICSCIFNCIFQILITLAIILAIITLILWFVFRPNVPKFHVDDVTLTQFNLSETNDTLHYNLNVNMTFRNPNRRLGIYYDKIEANGLYHGVRFSTADVVGFYLGHKKENNVSAVFKGEQVVSGVKGKYEAENGDGVFKIDLKLRLKIRFKVWWMKTPKFKPKFDCDLKVPLSVKGRVSDQKFERTKCDFDW